MVLVPQRGPPWIFGFDALFEALSAVVALATLAFAWKIHALTKDRKHFWLGASFGGIFLGLILKAWVDLVIHSQWLANLLGVATSAELEQVFIFGYGAFYASTLFSYAFLVITVMNIKGLSALIFGLIFAGMVYTKSYYETYYLYSAILLGLVGAKMYQNFLARKGFSTFATFGAFVLLTLAQLAFLLQPVRPELNPAAHIALFAGFLTLAGALFNVVLKKVKK